MSKFYLEQTLEWCRHRGGWYLPIQVCNGRQRKGHNMYLPFYYRNEPHYNRWYVYIGEYK